MATKCPKCVVDAVVLVAPYHTAIAKVAINKLKLKVKDEKRLLLTLKTAVREHAPGTVLPTEGDLRDYLANDAIIAVSVHATKQPQQQKPQQEQHLAGTSSTEPQKDHQQPELDISDAEKFECLDTLTMPDILALLSVSLGLRSFFRLSAACRSLRRAVTDCDSGAWWQDACARWSPLLAPLKASAPSTLPLSWRQLLQQQVAAAWQAWHNEDEYCLVLLVSTDPEPGLPALAMSGVHLLPLRLPGSGGSDVELKPEASITLGDLGSSPLLLTELVPLHDSVRLLLLRKSDGALIDLDHQGQGGSFLKSSSGLTGEPGATKELRLRFASDEDFDHDFEYRSKPASSRRAGATNDRRRPHLEGPVTIELCYRLPMRGQASASLLGADQYGAPFLASAKVLSLPIRDYWTVEELPKDKWRTVARDANPNTHRLHAALEAAHVTVLAQAWYNPNALVALLLNVLQCGGASGSACGAAS